jgi:endo-1,4-beta-xylanase
VRAISLPSLAFTAGFVVLGCATTETPATGNSGGSSTGGGAQGGSVGTGGTTSGGTTSSGGSATGGVIAASGGSATGGSLTGGSPSGGSITGTGGNKATGGAPSGGAPTGGTRTGGATATGGSATGGTATGGKATGGAATGGTATGGKATGGAATGGTATGGKATGGSATGGGSSVNCSGTPLSGGTQHCSSNATGTVGSFSWSIWSSGSGGCVTPYGVGAAYKTTWNNSGDFLAGVGFQWNETKTYDQYGTISADYAYTRTGTGGGYSYLGIYGWSNSPLIEFYIVDDYFSSGPPNITWGDGVLKGTFTVDGGTYKVFTHTQVNQPSIHGTQTFPQFFSVRQTARQCGHISVTEHFKQWASLGMALGKMASARLLTEVGGGSGSVDYTSATMTAQ